MLQIQTHTYTNVCTYMYINACGISMWYVKYRYVSLCVCICMHVCICKHTHIHTCVYVCMYVHGPDAGVPEQARFSGMHACMHACTYVYVYSCRCVNISISKSSNVRNKWLFDKLKPYSHAPRLCVHVRTHTAFVHEDMDICRQERGDRLGTYAQYASYVHTRVFCVCKA